MKSNKEVTVILSDGDNDYRIPLSKEKEFNDAINAFFNIEEYSDEWYEACEKIDSKFGKYKI